MTNGWETLRSVEFQHQIYNIDRRWSLVCENVAEVEVLEILNVYMYREIPWLKSLVSVEIVFQLCVNFKLRKGDKNENEKCLSRMCRKLFSLYWRNKNRISLVICAMTSEMNPNQLPSEIWVDHKWTNCLESKKQPIFEGDKRQTTAQHNENSKCIAYTMRPQQRSRVILLHHNKSR